MWCHAHLSTASASVNSTSHNSPDTSGISDDIAETPTGGVSTPPWSKTSQELCVVGRLGGGRNLPLVTVESMARLSETRHRLHSSLATVPRHLIWWSLGFNPVLCPPTPMGFGSYSPTRSTLLSSGICSSMPKAQ